MIESVAVSLDVTTGEIDTHTILIYNGIDEDLHSQRGKELEQSLEDTPFCNMNEASSATSEHLRKTKTGFLQRVNCFISQILRTLNK